MPIVPVLVAATLAATSSTSVITLDGGPAGCALSVEIASKVAQYRRELFPKENPSQKTVDRYQHLPKFHAWLDELNNGHMRAPEAERLTHDKCMNKEIE